MVGGIAAIGLLLALTGPATGLQPDDPVAPPPEGSAAVSVVSASGSGCYPGPSVSLRYDNTALQIFYGGYTVLVGVGASVLDFRKFCRLELIIQPPPGYTYAITRVDYTGFSMLADGATAFERTSYAFTGGVAPRQVVYSFAGPTEWDYWIRSEVVDPAALEWVPCDTPTSLTINTELRVSAGTSDPTITTSLLSLDPVDAMGDIYHLAWRQC